MSYTAKNNIAFLFIAQLRYIGPAKVIHVVTRDSVSVDIATSSIFRHEVAKDAVKN